MESEVVLRLWRSGLVELMLAILLFAYEILKENYRLVNREMKMNRCDTAQDMACPPKHLCLVLSRHLVISGETKAATLIVWLSKHFCTFCGEKMLLLCYPGMNGGNLS